MVLLADVSARREKKKRLSNYIIYIYIYIASEIRSLITQLVNVRDFLHQVLFFLPSFLPSPVVEEHCAAGYDDDHAAHPLVDQPPI